MTVQVSSLVSRATDYETIFILRPDIDSDASEKAINRVVTAIDQAAGKLLKIESWGKRRLAFVVQKQRKGFYVYVRYLGTKGLVAEIERNLRLLDSVLRYMTTVIARDVETTQVTVDPEEIKVRRIEIVEGEDDREESFEASLGLSDDSAAEKAKPEPVVERAPASDNAAEASADAAKSDGENGESDKA